MAAIRLDKLLAASGERTRSEAVRLLRNGLVSVDGMVQCDPSIKVDMQQSVVTLSGVPISDEQHQYAMLHKPAGLLTAARDSRADTVMSLMPEAFLRRKVLPVGRLDKDTTGLLLLTNDGELAHRLLSPKRHVVKEYHTWVQGELSQADVLSFAQGMQLSDFTAKPAELRILSTSPDTSHAALFLHEGKFHQVKRMFAARGHEVLSLHRSSFGPLHLTDCLPVGEYRLLTIAEVEALREAAGL